MEEVCYQYLNQIEGWIPGSRQSRQQREPEREREIGRVRYGWRLFEGRPILANTNKS